MLMCACMPVCRYKAKEVEAMRTKVPLGTLLKAIQVAGPVRDFRGAVLRRMKESGGPEAWIHPLLLQNIYLSYCYVE